MEKKVLYRLATGAELASENVPNTIPLGTAIMDNIVTLVEMSDKLKTDFFIARVECEPEQVEQISDGRFCARTDLIVSDGYLKMRDAVIKYSGIKFNE